MIATIAKKNSNKKINKKTNKEILSGKRGPVEKSGFDKLIKEHVTIIALIEADVELKKHKQRQIKLDI